MHIGDFVKDIGRGHDGARSLDAQRARDLFGAVFASQVGEFELGCILIALRMKGESLDELQGALAALDAYLLRIPVDAQRPAVAIPSYNGARRLPNLVPLLACLLARAGAQVVVHGVQEDPKRVTTCQLMRALGLPVLGETNPIGEPAAAFAAHQPLFVPIDLLSPPLARLLALRWRAGVRNIGHTLAKLIDPCAPGSLRLASFTHPEFDRLQHALFERLHAHALIMRGTEGEVVADPRRQWAVDELRNGQTRRLVEPDMQPLAEVPELPPAHDIDATCAWIREALAGQRAVPPNIARQVQVIMDSARPAA